MTFWGMGSRVTTDPDSGSHNTVDDAFIPQQGTRALAASIAGNRAYPRVMRAEEWCETWSRLRAFTQEFSYVLQGVRPADGVTVRQEAGLVDDVRLMSNARDENDVWIADSGVDGANFGWFGGGALSVRTYENGVLFSTEVIQVGAQLRIGTPLLVDGTRNFGNQKAAPARHYYLTDAKLWAPTMELEVTGGVYAVTSASLDADLVFPGAGLSVDQRTAHYTGGAEAPATSALTCDVVKRSWLDVLAFNLRVRPSGWWPWTTMDGLPTWDEGTGARLRDTSSQEGITP